MRAPSLILVAAFLLGVLTSSPASSQETQVDNLQAKTVPTQTLIDRARAFDAYTVAPIENGAFVHLLDPDGTRVNTWNIDVDRARLLPNCDLLVIHGSAWGVKLDRWKERRPFVTQYAWNGEIVWEYKANDIAHHDVHRLPNGNTIFLMREIIPSAPLLPAHLQGKFPAQYNSSAVLEVRNDGSIAWKWSAHEHFKLTSCGPRQCQKDADAIDSGGLFDWTHMNTVSVLPPNRWYDAGDGRFKPGNLLVMPRNFWSMYLIDRESGKIVWEYAAEKDGGLGPAHEPYMIEPGTPGAGNILVFSNWSKTRKKRSEVWELEPTTKKIVWRYADGHKFFSGRSGGALRLKNGNTLISSDKVGKAFEVTPEGKKVWELSSPWEFNRVSRYPRGYCEKLR